MRPGNPSSSFRPDIEGLRGIAVLVVVAFHCGLPAFSGGFIGVDVFFVLSGYLITGLLVSEIQKTSRLNLLQFYARRARRLLPASALTLCVALLVASVVMAPPELMFAGRAARASAIYMSNVFFGTNAADYFAPNVESNPLLHTWSLAVEEQFYFFWPLLILISLQWLRSRKALIVVLSLVTAISFAGCVWLTSNGGTFAFYQIPARAWEFGIGGLAVLSGRGNLKMHPRAYLALGWLGVITIFGSAYFILDGTNFPGWIALIPSLGTVTALLAGAEQPGQGVGILLNSPPLQFLGTLSYSWYLWHWPFLVLSIAIFPNVGVAGRVVAVMIALAVAAAAYRLVENPIRFHPFLMGYPARSLYLAVGITACSLTAAFLCMNFARRLGAEPQLNTITAAVDDVTRLPRPQCLSPRESSEIRMCDFADTASPSHLILFGDSHAIQWFNALQKIAESRHWRLTTILKSGCPAVNIPAPAETARFVATCDEWRADAIKRIVSMRPIFTLVADATVYLGGGVKPFGRKSLVPLADWQRGTKRTLEALTTKGINVVVMRDNPIFGYDVPTCVARSIRHSWYPGGSCGMPRETVLRPAIFDAELGAAQGLRGVQFVDMSDQYCTPDVCPAVWDGGTIYRDDNHLTGTFVDHLTLELEARLLTALAGFSRPD